MKISTQTVKPSEVTADAVVMVLFSDEKPTGELSVLDGQISGQISDLIDSGEISGKYREFTMIHTTKINSPRILIMGLGKKEEFDIDKIRSMSGRAARILRRINCKTLAYSSFTGLNIDPEESGKCIVEGIIMGLYHFKKYLTTRKHNENIENIIIMAKNENEKKKLETGAQYGRILAESTNLARDLVNEPANYLTPASFAKKAEEVADLHNMEIQIIDENEMMQKKMGAILAVGMGSENPPKIVVMKHKGSTDAPVLALVGKGITFDSGGLNIKLEDSMYRMYGDCSGACAVLGTMDALAQLKPDINVIGIMALAENMPSGRAYKPGDIVTSYSGKTIEIINTDAEGRLALADALTLAQEMKADYIVDIATLTGGCVTALGYTASGIMGNNDNLIELAKKAGNIAAEKLWQLPLFEDYFFQIHSDVADMENSGGRAASACTAGMFLKQFVDNKTPWIHIDIAGTAMIERERTPYLKKPYLPKEGGTGVGVRTMYHLAEIIAQNKEI